MKHTSVNCCGYGVDLITMDHETQRVTMVQWSWADVREFIHTHGTDMTETASGMVDTFLSKDTPEESKDE